MAGGKGKRLHPLTEDIPKPMIEINGLPMIHHLILKIKKQGFYKFTICVNYKKEIIQNYLEDGSKFDIEITYTEEAKPLGTAGSLSLIEPLKTPAILLNADVITNVDFQDILFETYNSKSDMMMVTKSESINIPYGVIETKGKKIISIKEKPNFDFVINTGIYVITEDVRRIVESNEYLDMPDLANMALEKGLKVDHFLCLNNWIDVGRFETLKKASKYL